MAQRLVQIMLPNRHDTELAEALRDRPQGTVWSQLIQSDVLLTWVLAPAERTESILDTLTDRFSAVEGFCVVLLPVEAVIPRPSEKESKPDDEQTPLPQKNHQRVSREELFEDISGASKLNRVFVVMVMLSAIVAAIGLMQNNVAVIIGAMVIAPLLGPNVALCLGTTLGDTELIRRAVRTNAIGVVLALALSALLGFMVPVDPAGTEIASRLGVTIWDVALALSAGAAGVLAFTSGAPATLIGVMVAVALMPPTVAAGLMFGSGHFVESASAAMLLIANVICVNLAGTIALMLQGVRPMLWWETDRARQATLRAIVLWAILLTILVIAIVWW